MPAKETFVQIQQGDTRGWEDLYKYFPYYVAMLTRRGICYEDAQDIVQDRFEKLFAYKDKIDVSDHPSSFVWNMVKNRGTDHLRRRDNHEIPLSKFEDNEKTGEYVNEHILMEANPVSIEGEVILHDEIDRALGRMSGVQREAVIMAGMGYNQREIADLIHEPLGTIKTRIRLGQEKAKHERIR